MSTAITYDRMTKKRMIDYPDDWGYDEDGQAQRVPSRQALEDADRFRRHVQRCVKGCRLTQFTGTHTTHSPRFLGKTDLDLGNLCDEGFDLYVPPAFMRRGSHPQSTKTSADVILVAMGFSRPEVVEAIQRDKKEGRHGR